VLTPVVGIMAKIIAHLESHPFTPALDPASPYLKYLSCLGEYTANFPPALRKSIKNPKKWKQLAIELAGKDRQVNSFLATTQAVDLIQGGVKVNALPEVVEGELVMWTTLLSTNIR
jgi:Gly-Xaa carboxypeptidase